MIMITLVIMDIFNVFFLQPHRTFIEQHWLMYSLILDLKKNRK